MAVSGDTEIQLHLDHRHALVSTLGASLRRYFRLRSDGSERDIVWGYSGSENKKGGQGDVLIPFPGRVRNGRYRFEGRGYQLSCNDKDGPNAIHGFVRGSIWEREHQSESAVQFRLEIQKDQYQGYPFSLNIRVSYELTPLGLECSFSVNNTGNTDAPVGVGFHPYFTVGTSRIDEAHLTVPASKIVEFGADLVPTGNVATLDSSPWDFRVERPIGSTRLNHCFTGLRKDEDGLARVFLRNRSTGESITVWMDSSFPYLVVYTGDTIPGSSARRALAVEPMSCATDALNRPEWGLVSLAPGASLGGRFGVTESL